MIASLTIDKLKQRIPQIIAAAARATQPLDPVWTCVAPGSVAHSAMSPAPPAAAPAWRLLRLNEAWGGAPDADPDAPARSIGWGIPADGGGNHWLRAGLRVPDEWRDQPVRLALEWSGAGQASLEGIAYVDGATLAGLDEFHRSIALPAQVNTGAHELLIRCYVPYRQPFGGISLQIRDDAIFQLGLLMQTIVQAIEIYRDADPIRHELLNRLNAAYNQLDLQAGWNAERFAASAHAALAYLRTNLTADLQPGQRPTLIATGHAHLDVAWLWPLWRTRQKVAHTVATALHLMERYPDYHFSMSQPQVYAFLKQDDPALYARMQERIAEGRFEPVGMMWLEPDCNIPSGESLVRQLLYGARFFAHEFGERNHVVWLPDVFGYSAALPQLLRDCGIQSFMTTKISWNQFNRMPYDTFRWRGIDGSEVLTHFVTATDQPVRHPADAQSYTYVGKMNSGEAFGTWNHYRQKEINAEVLYIFGWGDGGGGPTEEMLEAAQVMRDLPGFPQVQLGRVDQFFERLHKRVWHDPQLPTWVGELYLEYHRGTYTTQGRTKQANRTVELLYREAEWLHAWATLHGMSSRQEQLQAGWRLALLNQFHDILPGSSVPQVYVDSNAQYAEMVRIGQEVRAAALRHLLATGDQAHAGVEHPAAIMVVNSLPWQRRDVVRIDQFNPSPCTSVVSADGAPLLTQAVEEQPGEPALLAIVDAPAYGFTRLTTNAGSPATGDQPSTLHAERNILESDEFRLELDANGEIAALYDKRHNRDIILPGQTGNQLVAYEDRPLKWEAWDIDLYYEEKPYPVRDIVAWRVIETGPVRAAVEIVRNLGESRITQRLCLWAHTRRIDVVTEVDWQARQTLLRAIFPLNLNATRATCEIQFGAVERPTHRNTSWDMARFEVCAQRWVDLSEGDYGVALLNTGKYGHSLHDTTLGLSLLKGAIFPDADADRGLHRFTYSLLPHSGDWRSGAVTRRAYELNAPLIVAPPSASLASPVAHAPSSFLTCDAEHVVVETIKVAEDGDGLIVRLYEAHNQRGSISLTFAQPVASAEEVDLLERPQGAVSVDGATLRCAVRPFEVKTVRVRF